MICKKCNGQGVEKYVTQLDGDEDGVVAGIFAGLMTAGISLLFTTRVKERTCSRCGGRGRVCE